MARKYGKNETTLSNVLKLVKALLALADGEIDVPGDKLKASFKVEWVKEDELLVSGKVQEKRNNRTQTVEKGITKEDLWTLVESSREVLELSQVKDEKNKPTEAERKSNAIQDILDCLKDLDILVEKLIDGKPPVKTQGFWKFSLKLKHQTKTEENLKFITEQWKIKNGSVTVETSHQTVISKDKPLNWQEICRQNLAQQKELTTNPFTNAYGVTPQLDKVYVRLAIVERKPPKFPSRNQPEEKEEEKLIPITEDSFFEDVLRQGKSKISQGRKIAIIGEPGSGKTTRLQKIADWILKENLGLPIWVSLADLTQPTITQYIEEIWLKQTGKSLTIDQLTQQKERIWLLLDGLDEMTSRVETRHVSALLGGWVQGLRVVVTCRVNVWEADKNAFSGFDVFRNLEFNPEQVTDYIRCWFAEMRDAATGESLEAALAQSENSRLKELIQNPLRLWMLCQIWQTGGGLPETQAGLYEQFVDWVYRWKADEEILDQREAIDKALARLALAAMEQKDEVLRLRLRESWVLKVLGSRPIFQAVMKLGWLNRVERLPEAICVFYHATFQEYFAALAVDDWDYFLPRNHVNFPVPGKHYRIFEPQWKQVILLWLGRGDISDKEKFIEKLVNFDDGCGEWNFETVHRGFYKDHTYFLIAESFSEFSNHPWINTVILQLAEWCFCYKDDKKIFFYPVIEKSKKIFSGLRNKIQVEVVVKMIKKYFKNQTIFNEIVDYMRNKKIINLDISEELIKKLKIIFLTNTGQLHYEGELIVKLLSEARIEDCKIISKYILFVLELILIAFITAEKEYKILVNCDDIVEFCSVLLESISKIAFGCQNAIVLLEIALLEIQHAEIRYRAAKTLLTIDPQNNTALETLGRLVCGIDYCYEAALCLAEIGQTNEKAIDILVQITSTQNEKIFREIAQSLCHVNVNNFNFLKLLMKIFNSTYDNETKRLVCESLGKFNSNNLQAINALTKILATSHDKYVLRQAAESLYQIQPDNTVTFKILNQLLCSYNNDVWFCQIVSKTLGKVSPSNQLAIKSLEKLCKAKNLGSEYNRIEIAENLWEINPGNKISLNTLLELFLYNPDLKYPLRNALLKIGSENKLLRETVIDLLENEKNDRAYLQLVWLLDQISIVPMKVIEKVIQIANQKNNNQIYAAEILGTIDPGNIISRKILEYNFKEGENYFIRLSSLYSLLNLHIETEETIKIVLEILEAKTVGKNINSLFYNLLFHNLFEHLICVKRKELCLLLVGSLKKYVYVNDSTVQENFSLVWNCNDVIINCAQNLSYPDFYHAWHGLTEI